MLEKIKNKKVSVLGYCQSGVFAALLLKSAGNEVYLSDLSDKHYSEFKTFTDNAGITIDLNKHNYSLIEKSDLIVVSPGIPDTAEVIRFARKKNIRIIGEIELAATFNTKPVIAITGSNGKTTTTALTGFLLNASNKRALVCGNIGYAFSRALLENSVDDFDWIVLEISSFQIDTTIDFCPQISVLTNITPNHLDRYSSFDDYKYSKKNLFKNQKPTDVAILNFKDKESIAVTTDIKPTKLFFNTDKFEECIYQIDDEIIYKNKTFKTAICAVKDLKIIGAHNYENAQAASLAVLKAGADINSIIQALPNFTGVEHRLEFFGEYLGARFYNDSKATTTDAVSKSLSAFDCPVILIAGGRDKNLDFSVLTEIIRQKVKVLILTGEAAQKMNNQINLPDLTLIEPDFEKAVRLAISKVNIGDAVLLSPACTSYDRFNNFEERGRYFKKIVKEMIDEIRR